MTAGDVPGRLVVAPEASREEAAAVPSRPSAPARASDVVVVGAGLIGLACAWRLLQRGLRVVVLERGRPGEGASFVAAGMLAPVTEAEFGEEALLRLNLAAAHVYPRFVEELVEATGVDVGFRREGALYVALDRDEADEVRRLYEFQRSLDLAVEWLGPRACRRLEPGLAPFCAGGSLARDEAQVDPRALGLALLRAVEGVGGTVVAGAEVVAPLLDGERLAGVATADGRSWPAGEVLLATGCWSGSGEWLPERARPPVRPVKGQLLRLRTVDGLPLCDRIVRTPRVYVVPRTDGRVVIGATVEERGFELTVTAGAVFELLREAYRAVPDVAELEIVEVQAGLRPGTPDNAPLLGPGAQPGLTVATGHYRNGVLLAPITADAVAALLTGAEPPLDLAPFAPARFEEAEKRAQLSRPPVPAE